jgi:lipid II:glycine glycyltransferase (peptidoglycan interpeptide bridge formation enzyme)
MNQGKLEIKNLEGLSDKSPLALAWSDLVNGNPASGFMQSLEWARFKAQQGIACKHLGIFEGQNLIAGGLFYFMASDGVAFLVAPDGPVIPWQDERLSLECLTLIIDYCERLANEEDRKLIGLRVEPRLPVPVPDMLLEFGRAPMDLIPRETVYLDLTPSLAQILAGMKPKGRYNTRLAERKGVQVRTGSAGEIIDTFYPLLCETARRDDFAVEPPAFWVEMASTLMADGTVSLLLAEHGGAVIGGLLLLVSGTTATYLYGGISNTKRNCMAGYALQWSAIKLAKEAGCTQYDMYGFDRFCSPSNRYGRFSKFKSQFGGEVVRFIGAHDYYFIDQLADTLVKAFNEINN